MATLFEVYKEAYSKLENPRKDEINIRILLCEINGLNSMTEFYIKKDENIRDLQRFYSNFARFLAGEPIQYIISKADFFGSQFYVDKRVLIPRQETEEVALYAMRKILNVFGEEPVVIADVCCGSGCIGISLAKHLKLTTLYMSDISKDACDVAVENLSRNSVDGYVLNGNALEPFIKHNIKVDVIVCNPPYILIKDDVDKSVLDYEPHNALFVDDDLGVYRAVLLNAYKVMKEKLLIVFEIGYDLQKKLIELLAELYWDCVFTFRKDINGKDRIFSVLLESKIES